MNPEMKLKGTEPVKNKGSWNILLILPILGFVIYSILWNNVDMIRLDLPGYVSAAKDISDGHIDQLNIRTPGFPLLLLLTRSLQYPSSILFYIQLLMYTLSVIALSWILYELKVLRKLIFLFSVFALLPYNVAMTTAASTELLTAFTLVFGLFFLFIWLTKGKIIYLVFSVGFFGYAAITRPTYQIILFVFVFILIIALPYMKEYKKKFVSYVIALGISSFFIIGSLLYINYEKFNFIGLTPLFGFNLCTRTVTVIERLPDDHSVVRDMLIKYRNMDLIEENSSHRAYNYIWKAIPELKEVTNLEMTDLEKYIKEINFLLIREEPLPYLREVGSATARYWLPYMEPASNFDSKVFLLIFYLIHFFLIISFFLLLIFMFGLVLLNIFFNGKYKFFNKNDELFLITLSVPLAIIFFTMFISTFIEVGYSRYRTPTDLFIMFSIISIFSFIKRKSIERQD